MLSIYNIYMHYLITIYSYINNHKGTTLVSSIKIVWCRYFLDIIQKLQDYPTTLVASSLNSKRKLKY